MSKAFSDKANYYTLWVKINIQYHWLFYIQWWVGMVCVVCWVPVRMWSWLSWCYGKKYFFRH